MRQLKTFMRNRKKEMLACGPCECRTLQCWRYANENCGCGESPEEAWIEFTFKFNCLDDETDTVVSEPGGSASLSSVIVPEWTEWEVEQISSTEAVVSFVNDGRIIKTVTITATAPTNEYFYFIDGVGWGQEPTDTLIKVWIFRFKAITVPVEVHNEIWNDQTDEREETSDTFWTVNVQTVTVPKKSHGKMESGSGWWWIPLKVEFYDPMNYWDVIATIIWTPIPVWNGYFYGSNTDFSDYTVDENTVVQVFFDKEPAYTITINVNDESLGSVNKSLSYASAIQREFDFDNNEMYMRDTIVATPADGADFVAWTYDDDNEIQEWDPITWDMTIVAKFGPGR